MTANNGGVFYMQDVPNVLLVFNGNTTFTGNSLNNGGMGGVIGNGWLSSVSGSGYTQGGKIVFDGIIIPLSAEKEKRHCSTVPLGNFIRQLLCL